MNPPPRLSVALCTFNGETFLAEQLQSLLDQSHSPDELVVFDDGSTDGTIDLLERFARMCPFAVKIHRNETNLGPAQNFARAIVACGSEIISFCDQDDIWEANKIALTLAEFDRDPQVAFVFSDALICDTTCQPVGYGLWNSVGFAGRLRTQFEAGSGLDVLLRQNVVTGATLSFASRYKSLVLPIPPGWMHDGWIALLLSAVGRGRAVAQPLVRYRQHADQSIGAQRRSLYQQYLNAKAMSRTVFSQQADQYESALARLQEQTDFEVSTVTIRKLQEKIHHCHRRAAIREGQTGRMLPVMLELLTGRYNRYSLGWKSCAQDLFL